MTAKKRYLVQVPAHVRHAAGFALEDVTAGLASDQIVRAGKSGSRVLTLDDAEHEALLKAYPGLLIEEDQDLTLLGSMPGLGFQVTASSGQVLDFVVVDAHTDKPIAGVTVFAQGAQATYRAKTGRDGKARVMVFESDIHRVIVSPAAQYWSRVVAPPEAGKGVKVALTPLVPEGANAWGRRFLGLDAAFPFRGAGVKVALIDSGVAEHPDLVLSGGLNTLDGDDPQDFRRDEKGHGTHCAGVVAGRGEKSGVMGVAPDVDLYSVKVFPGGKLSDLLEGLQWAIDQGMDVVSMSLGMQAPSAQLAMKLAEAAHQGIVLVAAVGNEAGPVAYPAANEGVLGVSALGSSADFPPDSAHTLRIGSLHNPANGLFVANFANHGSETAFIAPGVAVVSSVPGGYAAWDGSSMACPHVAGLAALVLGAHPELAQRNLHRVRAVHAQLAAGCVDLGLPPQVQGSGVPRADAMLKGPLGQRQAATTLAARQQDSLRQLEPLIADLQGKQQEIQALLARLG
jgi:subtilisin family serine protease